MLIEIHNWIEQYAGISYDYTEDIKNVSGDFAFLEPFEWRTTIEMVFDGLSDALDVIENYQSLIPEEFPNKSVMKKLLVADVVQKVLKNVNHIKKQLMIDIVQIHNFSDLNVHVSALVDLIEMLISNDIEDIIRGDIFEKCDDNCGNILTETFEIHKNDLTNMHFTVSSIRESNSESSDD